MFGTISPVSSSFNISNTGQYNYTTYSFPSGYNISNIFTTNGKVYLSNGSSTMYYSLDNGATFTQKVVDNSFAFFSVSHDNQYWLYTTNTYSGIYGNVYCVSNDYGATFTRTALASTTVRGVAMSYNGQYMFVATRPFLYRSTNYGASFGTVSIGNNDVANVSVSLDGKYVCAVSGGTAKVLYRSSDYGATFTRLFYDAPSNSILLTNVFSAYNNMSGDGNVVVNAGSPGYEAYLTNNFLSPTTLTASVIVDPITPANKSRVLNNYISALGISAGVQSNGGISVNGQYILVPRTINNRLFLSSNYGNSYTVFTTNNVSNISTMSTNGKYIYYTTAANVLTIANNRRL